jgi:hypothetical protein
MSSNIFTNSVESTAVDLPLGTVTPVGVEAKGLTIQVDNSPAAWKRWCYSLCGEAHRMKHQYYQALSTGET